MDPIATALYEDDFVKISFLDRGMSTALVSFSGIGLKMAGQPQEEFKKSVPEEYSVYFCIDKCCSWYNSCFQTVVDTLSRDILERGITEVKTIGNSMGGFGAILFAKYLPNCRHAVAFVPQTSIKPSVVPFENRYIKFSDKISRWIIEDVLDHIVDSVHYCILYGDQCSQDGLHANRLASKLGGCPHELVVFPNASHDLARELKMRGIGLNSVLERCLDPMKKLDSLMQRYLNVLKSQDLSDETNSKFRNDLELQLFGLQRSGNHAVVAWILQQYDSPSVFLNNVEHFQDPFLDFRAGEVDRMVPLSKNNKNYQNRLRNQKKHLLFYSYENLFLPRLVKFDLVPNRDELLGHSRHVRRILLLRDFFNWFSSRIKLMEFRNQDTSRVLQDPSPLVNLWLVYAKEFIGETNYLGAHEVVPISFPRWSVDSEYRAYLLGLLRLPYRSNDNSNVPDVGGGSSFDRTKFSGAVSKMDLDKRWQYLSDEKFSTVRSYLRKRKDEISAYNDKALGVKWPDEIL